LQVLSRRREFIHKSKVQIIVQLPCPLDYEQGK
jgi:hypothetical protein